MRTDGLNEHTCYKSHRNEQPSTHLQKLEFTSLL